MKHLVVIMKVPIFALKLVSSIGLVQCAQHHCVATPEAKRNGCRFFSSTSSLTGGFFKIRRRGIVFFLRV